MLDHITPDITPSILRNASQPTILMAICAVNIPNAITRRRIKVFRRALEPQERGTRPIHLIALLEARQQHFIRTFR